MGGIVREIGGALRAANARPDHVHLLCSLPPTVAISDALRLVKTNSSRWVHRERRLAGFDWQTGYGAFSVSHSLAPSVTRYIGDQEKIAPRLAPWATIFRPLCGLTASLTMNAGWRRAKPCVACSRNEQRPQSCALRQPGTLSIAGSEACLRK
jgi:hypothetical protein